MVVFAPQTLIYADIQWEVIDDLHVKAIFSHAGITIEAMLIFDEQGRIINFISHDRLALEKRVLQTTFHGLRPYQNIIQ